MKGRDGFHFSFAGLKTALRQQAKALEPLKDGDVADLCASFESAVADAVTDRVARAMDGYLARVGGDAPRHLIVAGGVAANLKLGIALRASAEAHGFQLHVPPVGLCTDNGAMIAWAGIERYSMGWVDGLDVEAKARWPLDASAPLAGGAGIKA